MKKDYHTAKVLTRLIGLMEILKKINFYLPTDLPTNAIAMRNKQKQNKNIGA